MNCDRASMARESIETSARGQFIRSFCAAGPRRSPWAKSHQEIDSYSLRRSEHEVRYCTSLSVKRSASLGSSPKPPSDSGLKKTRRYCRVSSSDLIGKREKTSGFGPL